jgi:geranylgeranyl pyrophosphate synthase
VIESKRTLMVIHCLTTAGVADRERLVTLLRRKHDKTLDEAAEVVDLITRYGSVDYARSMARDLIMEGRGYLSAVRESQAREILASMARYFLEREK